MSRERRILVDNAYYHILTRGNDRKKIFRGEQDFEYFLQVLKDGLEKFCIHIFHYCLMPDHLHLLIHVNKGLELPKFMQRCLLVYANYFRKKYDSVGFLFQNRYKSILINKESYLLECARYIERNPLRSRLTDYPQNYPWNSLSYYIEGQSNSIIRKANPLFLELGENTIDRQNRFRDYVLQDRPYDKIVD